MQQLMTAIARKRRIVKPPRNELDPDALQALFFELLGQVLFDRSPFSENVDPFLIFLEHALHQDDSDLLPHEGIFIECIANDVREPPGPEEVLVEFLELTFP